MFPEPLVAGSFAVSVWNCAFILAAICAYLAYRQLAVADSGLSYSTLRFFCVVYLSTIAAQFFAYAFDATTSLEPPIGVNVWDYYLNPLAGPKTLYGAIVLMPVTVTLGKLGTGMPLGRALDLWAVPMLVMLSIVRVGCLLQGCCYGARSEMLGVAFPPGSPAYSEQVVADLIPAGSGKSLPVIPTQAMEALFLALLASWCWRRRSKSGNGSLFLISVIAYSAFRFPIEFIRGDVERGFYGPLSTSQWISLAVLAAAVMVIAVRRSPASRWVAPAWR